MHRLNGNDHPGKSAMKSNEIKIKAKKKIKWNRAIYRECEWSLFEFLTFHVFFFFCAAVHTERFSFNISITMWMSWKKIKIELCRSRSIYKWKRQSSGVSKKLWKNLRQIFSPTIEKFISPSETVLHGHRRTYVVIVKKKRVKNWKSVSVNQLKVMNTKLELKGERSRALNYIQMSHSLFGVKILARVRFK